METKLKQSHSNVSSKLCQNHLQNHLIVDCDTGGGGRSGGLALIWHNDVNLHVIAYNKMLIDFYVWDSSNNERWNATGIYGFPYQT